MKCNIPEISWHNRDPVLTVDFQCKSKDGIRRLASGGTDSHVIIWYVDIKPDGTTTVEFASDLQRHQKAVNVVRFSPNGETLASGDDDAVIFIWKQSTINSSGLLFENEGTKGENQEHWLVFKILRGHIEDICDLSWSSDSLYIASGSVDNSAILWDVNKGSNCGILKEHKGFVQGVAWDPLNKYLATLSSDRLCRIYRLNTKRTLYKVSKGSTPLHSKSGENGEGRLYHDDTLKSYCRRLCFTPDGQLLITPSGVVEASEKGQTNTNLTYIFSRSMLNKPAICLNSKDKYTVAVRCCPTLFDLRPEGGQPVVTLAYRMIFAVATQSSILMYDTQQKTPFAVVYNIHYTRLCDLSWSCDGRVLVVSSTDGYCSLISFEEGELGTPHTLEKAMNIIQNPFETPVKSTKKSRKQKVPKKTSVDNTECNSPTSAIAIETEEKSPVLLKGQQTLMQMNSRVINPYEINGDSPKSSLPAFKKNTGLSETGFLDKPILNLGSMDSDEMECEPSTVSAGEVLQPANAIKICSAKQGNSVRKRLPLFTFAKTTDDTDMNVTPLDADDNISIIEDIPPEASVKTKECTIEVPTKKKQFQEEAKRSNKGRTESELMKPLTSVKIRSVKKGNVSERLKMFTYVPQKGEEPVETEEKPSVSIITIVDENAHINFDRDDTNTEEKMDSHDWHLVYENSQPTKDYTLTINEKKNEIQAIEDKDLSDNTVDKTDNNPNNTEISKNETDNEQKEAQSPSNRKTPRRVNLITLSSPKRLKFKKPK